MFSCDSMEGKALAVFWNTKRNNTVDDCYCFSAACMSVGGGCWSWQEETVHPQQLPEQAPPRLRSLRMTATTSTTTVSSANPTSMVARFCMIQSMFSHPFCSTCRRKASRPPGRGIFVSDTCTSAMHFARRSQGGTFSYFLRGAAAGRADPPAPARRRQCPQ